MATTSTQTAPGQQDQVPLEVKHCSTGAGGAEKNESIMPMPDSIIIKLLSHQTNTKY
jgi:hypothetical protein